MEVRDWGEPIRDVAILLRIGIGLARQAFRNVTLRVMAAGRPFQNTRWSLIFAACDRGSREEMEELCRAYWFPLYAFIRRRGYDADLAEDLTQEFFARLIGSDDLRCVDRPKGKFRSF